MAKNQELGSASPPVPTEEGLPLYEAARIAHSQGRTIYTCSVVTATTKGSSGLSLRGGKRGAGGQEWDPATLIEAIEGEGWRLQQMGHTWHQTEHNAALGHGAALITGIVTAHMLFRRA